VTPRACRSTRRPIPAHPSEAQRIEFGNLTADAVGQTSRAGAARDSVAAIEEGLGEPAEDEEF